MNRRREGDDISLVIDDDTAARLRASARVRGIDVAVLTAHLLYAASFRIDDLLPDEVRVTDEPQVVHGDIGLS